MCSPKVLLTGINGFIGSHILDTLLAHGISVRGIVRTRKKADQVQSDFPSAGSKLSFTIVPDITAPGAFDEAFKSAPSIEVVIHTASPLSYAAGKTLADFVEPAKRGTMEILEGATHYAPSLRRMIITGSFASIANPKDMQGNGKVYNSDDWNPLSTDEGDSENSRLAYWTSKTLAERAAWDFMNSSKPHYDLVVLNPPMVYGPLRHTIKSVNDLNVSVNNIWRDFLNSSKDAAIVAEWVHADIDVRDLAEAHYKAMLSTQVSNKRYLITRGRVCNQQIADILRKSFPGQLEKIPLGNPGESSLPPDAFDVDGSDAVRDLELEFRTVEETFKDLGKQLLDLDKGVPTTAFCKL